MGFSGVSALTLCFVVKASRLLGLRFTVREFYYDEKEIKREREEMTRLLSDKKQQYVSIMTVASGFSGKILRGHLSPHQRPPLSPLRWAHTTQEHVLSWACQSRVWEEVTGTRNCGGCS